MRRLWPLLLLPLTLSATPRHSAGEGAERALAAGLATPPSPRAAEGGGWEQLPGPREPAASVPTDAVRVAFVQAAQLDPYDRRCIRWVWVQSGEEEDVKAVSWLLNQVTRSPFVRQCPVYGGILVQVDLRWLFDDDLDEGIDLWEQLAFDPMLSQIITHDTLVNLARLGRGPFRQQRWENKWTQDDKGHWRFKEHRLATVQVDVKDVVVVRLNNRSVQRAGYSLLQDATQSLAPIVSARYFIGRVFSSVKSRTKVKENGKEVERDNVFSVVWGGLYYEFAGIRRSKVKGRTDLDQLLFDLGISERFCVLFERLKSDQRAALFRSGVTKKPRRIVWFPQLATRLTEALPAVFITEDVLASDVDHGAHPVKNLVDFTPRAFEVLFVRQNGSIGYAIYNEQEELLEQADQNVVSDRTVPNGDSTILQSGISCARCHGSKDLWQPFSNDVDMLSATALDVFFDTSRLTHDEVQRQINRLVGQYAGNPSEMMRRLRMDAATNAIRATGPWKGKDFGDAAKLAAARTAELYALDRHEDIDAAQALRDLGFRVPTEPGAAVAMMRELFPPDLRLANGLFVPEDVALAGLIAGKRVRPFDWMLSYSYALERVGK